MLKESGRYINNFWFRLFIIVLFSLPVYSIHFDMFYDAEDFELLAYRPFSELITWFKGGNFFHYIPLPMTLYTIEYHIFPDSPIPYRMVNYILHVLCSLLIYSIIKYTARKEVAFFASVIFTVLPVHLNTVVALNHRQDLFYTLFSLLSLLYFIRFIRMNGGIRAQIFSFLFFFLGLLSKESTIMLPFLLLCYDLFFGENKDFKSLSKRHFPFFLLGGLYILYRFHLFGSIGSYGSQGLGESPYTFGGFILTNYNWYLHRLAQPFPIYTTIIILAIFFYKQLFKNRIFPFAVCWFVFSMLPVYPFNGERFIYLASFGYVYLIAELFVTLFEGKEKKISSGSKFIDYSKPFLFILSFLFMGYFGIGKSVKNLSPHDHRLMPILVIFLLGCIYIYRRLTSGQKLKDFMAMGKGVQTFTAVSFLLIILGCSIITLWLKEYTGYESSNNYKNIHDCIVATCKDDIASETEFYYNFFNLKQTLHALTLPPVYFVKHTRRQNFYFPDYYDNRKKFGPIKANKAYFFDVDNWNCSPRNDITKLMKRRAEIERSGTQIHVTRFPLDRISITREDDFTYYNLSFELHPLSIDSVNFTFRPKKEIPDSQLILSWISENSPVFDSEKSITARLEDAKRRADGSLTASFDVGNSLFWHIYGSVKRIQIRIPSDIHSGNFVITYSQFSKKIDKG